MARVKAAESRDVMTKVRKKVRGRLGEDEKYKTKNRITSSVEASPSSTRDESSRINCHRVIICRGLDQAFAKDD